MLSPFNMTGLVTQESAVFWLSAINIVYVNVTVFPPKADAISRLVECISTLEEFAF